ncbi:ArsR family transcriptional regulator, partial [Streptomyces sp. NPDC005093]
SVAALVGRYHDESAPGGRTHRVIVGLHQIPAPQPGVPGGTAAPRQEAGGTNETESEAGQEDRP